jgi:hypothetical protein
MKKIGALNTYIEHFPNSNTYVVSTSKKRLDSVLIGEVYSYQWITRYSAESAMNAFEVFLKHTSIKVIIKGL